MPTKIAIVGAGPGGLCLANILQRKGIEFTIFEGDKSPNERNQGGTLDLHPRDGQLAMKEAGLWDEFLKYSRPEADVLKIVTFDGKVLWDGNTTNKVEIPEERRKPEIDRQRLQEILFANIKPDNIRFGRHLQQVTQTSTNKFDLHFREGITENNFDLVVGADGSWSKVRKLVTPELPHYSGISALELWLDDADTTNPWLSQYIGAGSCFSFSDGRALLIQRLGNGTIRTYACLRKPESFFNDSTIDLSNPNSAIPEFIDEHFSDISPDLKQILLGSNTKLVPRTLYMLPVGFKWASQPGVALLGDAAHVMTPFGGVGVNAALADAVDLAKTIIQATTDNTDLNAALRGYDERMFVRAEGFANRTYKGLQGHFSAGGSEALAKRHHDAYAAAK